MGEIEIARHRWVSSDDRSAQKSVLANATDTTILEFQTPPGLRGFISFLGVAWDGGMDTYVDYTLLVNGAVIFPYVKSKVQVAPPEDASRELPVYVPVQGASYVKVIANQSISGTAGNFTARVVMKYTDPLEDLRP